MCFFKVTLIVIACGLFLILGQSASLPIFGNVKASETSSTCYGSTSKGRIKNSKSLPIKGKNYRAYTGLTQFLGRNYVHSTIKKIILESYESLEKNHPHYKYIYGETGHKTGGSFEPHKTHQNGLSVDFMVPVRHQQTSWH